LTEIISLKQKRHQKELKYERKMLKELNLTEIKAKIDHCFRSFEGKFKKTIIEDGCIDFAIEAFLLGAKYSRFGYYGESMQSANKRCQFEEKRLIDDFFDYLMNWGKIKEGELSIEELFIACEYFIHSWWEQGYTKGEKRYKLRLH